MNIVEIPLSNGQHARVSEADAETVSRHKWHIDRPGGKIYAATNFKNPDGTKRTLRMHQLIVRADRGQHIDHVNGDGLDNTRENLRACTAAQNVRNAKIKADGKTTSRFKGVFRQKSRQTWNAHICVNFKTIHLGAFDDEEWAARAYDAAAKKHFGEFSKLNFPSETYSEASIYEHRRK